MPRSVIRGGSTDRPGGVGLELNGGDADVRSSSFRASAAVRALLHCTALHCCSAALDGLVVELAGAAAPQRRPVSVAARCCWVPFPRCGTTPRRSHVNPSRHPTKVESDHRPLVGCRRVAPSSWDLRHARHVSMDGTVDSTLSIRKGLGELDTAKCLSCFIVVCGCVWRRRQQHVDDMSRRKRGRLYPRVEPRESGVVRWIIVGYDSTSADATETPNRVSCDV